ncbi:MAG: sigma-54-dependent Fis family transcriptional regulator [Muribaculaceae bacterium]|nr:sigma-54-dependent Fis family transcriptional regulator [Muribaculaceae bacterium]
MKNTDILNIQRRFGIIGNAPVLINAIERALQVAPIDLSVLIIGESGTGKEFFPQIIHTNSARKHNKYIAVNCGAIPEGTIDSELFGHEKGAFTGAISSRKGYFEEANGGTIFLDEVAELPLTTQARLLRVLESGEYLRVGSSEVQKTNIRIVAATNKDMTQAVKEGKFREDLFYRLSTVQIIIPPLRERGNDILLLTRKFSHDFADNHRMPPVEYDESAKGAILNYRWPGNVRQLKNIVEQIALFEAGNTIDREKMMQYLPAMADNTKPIVASNNSQFDYNQERELVFKMIFQMQKKIEEIDSLLKNANVTASHINADVAALKRESKQLVPITTQTSPSLRQPSYELSDNDNQHPVHDVNIVDIDAHPSIKTLEDTERETIIHALERNRGKRKKTAEELNISERTLYRKIKEYGLD